jgi:ribosome maturation factor RimP
MGLRLSAHLEELIATTVQGLGFVYVGAESISSPKVIFRVYVEGPLDPDTGNTPIKLDEITVITRQLNALLDVEVPSGGHYRLEVSSPGLDRRLFKVADYQRFLGHEAKIRLHRPQQERRNWTGVIAEVGDTDIKLKVANEIYTLAFDNIDNAHLVPQFKFK